MAEPHEPHVWYEAIRSGRNPLLLGIEGRARSRHHYPPPNPCGSRVLERRCRRKPCGLRHVGARTLNSDPLPEPENHCRLHGHLTSISTTTAATVWIAAGTGQGRHGHHRAIDK
ncbi:hypothetical protein BS78_09G111200 [Paspalum vaginatum]|nr:hypothetical protein BS78_09G111200 [Paspalum vaginatum]